MDDIIKQFFEARKSEDRMLTKLEMMESMQKYMVEKIKKNGFRKELDLKSIFVYKMLHEKCSISESQSKEEKTQNSPSKLHSFISQNVSRSFIEDAQNEKNLELKFSIQKRYDKIKSEFNLDISFIIKEYENAQV